MSSEMMSPLAARPRSPNGIPWTTSSLIDAHRLRRIPAISLERRLRTRRAGRAFRHARRGRPWSPPARPSGRNSSRMSATSSLATRIRSIPLAICTRSRRSVPLPASAVRLQPGPAPLQRRIHGVRRLVPVDPEERRPAPGNTRPAAASAARTPSVVHAPRVSPSSLPADDRARRTGDTAVRASVFGRGVQPARPANAARAQRA